MSLNDTFFKSVERGATSVYKFQVKEDPNLYLWFEFADGSGALYTTPQSGPYDTDHPLSPAEFNSLDDLLAARGTTKEQWVKDLMAQYGERIAWTYAG